MDKNPISVDSTKRRRQQQQQEEEEEENGEDAPIQAKKQGKSHFEVCAIVLQFLSVAYFSRTNEPPGIIAMSKRRRRRSSHGAAAAWVKKVGDKHQTNHKKKMRIQQQIVKWISSPSDSCGLQAAG